ncbi:UDP-N-acetylmuramoyl-L-alanine--D-glutamate ligase [Arenimonas caeni]|uniref:UDP-N-acetylmuramoyl-L-alanine--L-glutamate ligase n=1 Tax=Arenimonas caeni TaxID=2058085 RepID=A0A2P6M7U9_9GAMM|nr:UDP-N-acetylmuramoyl-L-alanine--D-glutamate ligase [Arenimonas caeni]MDY0022906.1 UDP-N-acetylmuramoyl-L-alanine--D-glutamate ligase [Arenimonas caeni]PRH82066.1 UDP-N-acetylmuramoyl-L-alanine--D-glutamate ligase [Arenimonas caeni]
MRISELEGKRVAIWGYGREGRSALAALRWRLPSQPVTVFCSHDEAEPLREMQDPALRIETSVNAEMLAGHEIVVKSPGISPYTSPAADAALEGVRFVGASGLWFAEPRAGRRICITGSKGKSTTTALVAHLLRASGARTALAGNIGLPLLELLDVQPPPEYWAIELSSYQTGDAADVDVAVVLNLFPEHLDWHGSEARYYADKLRLVTQAAPRLAVLNAGDQRLVELDVPADTRVLWFNHADGWHLREAMVYRGDVPVLDARHVALPGRHNRLNLCAALATIEALGLDAVGLAAQAHSFRPLPHRLQSLGLRHGIESVNDSISTTPQSAIAALDCYRGRRVAILVGGYDRGLDWGIFAERIAAEPVAAVITMGQNGPRVFEKLKPLSLGNRFFLAEAEEMEQAVKLGLQVLGHDGVLLLSPGAPSFPRYRDYAERGRHFAQAAGFDPELICAIPGLGVA